ncbi:hypothetical protein C0585_02285 [Candidatus Woesearchaeota archaeon]|nr:MAG: hypothetical protein C0585_02285 [Candidatus Woesearchaeota archaeon]
MRFAHIADCHLGGWRDQKMRELSIQSFEKAISFIIDKNVDFLLLSGDLFNTSHPGIDILKIAVSNLKKLQKNNIPIYAIAGSHDFSPSGKTMLDVLEEAGLLFNIVKGEVKDNKLRLKFTTDRKTDAKIAGMLGKKGSLERNYYEDLDRENLESEKGFKIFMFHTAIEELKPKSLEKMSAEPISILPKGFDYYAGGHVHIIENRNINNYSNVVYPGPTYPNNFRELEELKQGSFSIFDNGKVESIMIPSKKVTSITINCDMKQAKQVEIEVLEKISNSELYNNIVLLRFKGKLVHSKVQDIDFNKIVKECYSKAAYFVMRNTSLLSDERFEDIRIDEDNVDNIEERLIDEHIEEFKHENELIRKEELLSLMKVLADNKIEGETNTDFESRLIKDIDRVLEKDNI